MQHPLLDSGAVCDGPYRYTLWRLWDRTAARLAFVMLNPSTADAERDDPTIRRCLGFARSLGFGSIEVVNLFAYRSCQPAALRTADDPVGPHNDRFLLRAARRADLVVAAWGVHGALLNRDREVLDLLAGSCSWYCLGQTRSGHPRHPLYLPGSALVRPLQPQLRSSRDR